MAWTHRLSAVDTGNRSATCAHCGPVKVKRHGAGWRCTTPATERRAADRQATKTRRADGQEELARRLVAAGMPAGGNRSGLAKTLRGLTLARTNWLLRRFEPSTPPPQ